MCKRDTDRLTLISYFSHLKRALHEPPPDAPAEPRRDDLGIHTAEPVPARVDGAVVGLYRRKGRRVHAKLRAPHKSSAEEEGYASPVEAAETSRSIQFGRCPGQRSARGRSLLESLQCVHRLSNEDGRCSVCEARHEALGAYHCI